MADPLINLTRVNHARRGRAAVFGEAYYMPGGVCGPRIQRDWQLVILLSGSAVSCVGDERRAMGPGMVTLQVPGQTETVFYDPEHPTHHTWIAIQPEAVGGELASALHAAPKIQRVTDTLNKTMEMVMSQPRYEGAWHEQWIDQVGLNCLIAYLCATEVPVAELRPRSVMDAAVRFMEEHLADENCLGRAAAAASITPQHLARRFQAEVGLSPSEWLWRLRLERAADFLLYSGLTVLEISQRCGFKTVQHFARRFQRQYRQSPARYRREAWGPK